MDSFAQTSSGCAEARAANARRSRGAAGRRRPQPRARRKVVARSAEDGAAVVAAADVPRRRTAMPSSPERVGARGRRCGSATKGERAASGCGPGAETEQRSLSSWTWSACVRFQRLRVAASGPEPALKET
jgi:hypothetical protein